MITAYGIKPIGSWQWLFKVFWLYGAVEPLTIASFFWQFSHVDTQCYQRFLNEFSLAYPDSVNILQVDNGRFHKGKDLIVPENVILRHLSGGILAPENAVLFQPPYCQATFWGGIFWDESFIPKMTWESSPHSLAPELNPIERLWEHLKCGSQVGFFSNSSSTANQNRSS